MRKRKPRVVWLPPDISDANPANVDGSGWRVAGGAALAISGGSPTASQEIGITTDFPADPQNNTLSDIENSGYRLRRIVGKIWVVGDTLDDDSGIVLVGCTAGLIVRRVDQAGASLASQVGTNQDQASPSQAENWSDPWIWRRSWLLNNPQIGFTGAAANPYAGPDVPYHNAMNGSALDGPHVDQKTARIVGPEERLFLDISVTALLGADGASQIENLTDVFFELRVLANMKTSIGNRRNASR